MSRHARRPRVGQWYLRRDTDELFQVADLDESQRTVEIQTFEGDLDEMDMETWRTLPLELADPPEDWTGPIDLEDDDLPAESSPSGAIHPQARPMSAGEAWEDSTTEEEIDSFAERIDPGELH